MQLFKVSVLGVESTGTQFVCANWLLNPKQPLHFLLKSSLFSEGHRGARKMNLFYNRGCENHNLKVPPK